MPVLRVGVGLQPVAADVEPDGRVEGDLLGQQQVGELVMEDGGVLGGGEVAARDTPVADGLGHAGDELAHAGLALRRSPIVAVEVFGGDDVGRGHRPVDGNLDVLLLEDGVARCVGDQGGAALPLDFVVGGDTGLGEHAGEVHARGSSRFGSGGIGRVRHSRRRKWS